MLSLTLRHGSIRDVPHFETSSSVTFRVRHFSVATVATSTPFWKKKRQSVFLDLYRIRVRVNVSVLIRFLRLGLCSLDFLICVLLCQWTAKVVFVCILYITSQHYTVRMMSISKLLLVKQRNLDQLTHTKERRE